MLTYKPNWMPIKISETIYSHTSKSSIEPRSDTLKDLTRMAALFLDTPMAGVTYLNSQKQIFLSNHGIPFNEIPKTDSICQFAEDDPDNVLVIEDAQKDERLHDNPLVWKRSGIRFYAGAPLVLDSGKFIGTLCVIDVKPRKITSGQEMGLTILADRILTHIEKLIASENQNIRVRKSASKLRLLTDHLPVGVFQVRLWKDHYSLEFVNQWLVSDLEHVFNGSSPEIIPRLLENMNPIDKRKLFRLIIKGKGSPRNISTEFRLHKDASTRWYNFRATIEQIEDNNFIVYGSLVDVTKQVIHSEDIDQILFDLSHLVRAPVTNIIGLTELIRSEYRKGDLPPLTNLNEMRYYFNLLQSELLKLDNITHDLDKLYQKKRLRINHSN